ncbi:melanopsin-B-like isoform X2 [Argiope bruennichi]|uniref:Melanopsin-B like protein n=2 Tax=Argiope bruennichi TaxID=94029 RepID=A0A8T0FVV7_ARGBR|nr:melanopsin-B-like isoform X2 [Argiope bruennichi]XP_055931403.1 melanopsin-B-like isoform X2 [Argiope bruennichi]KAF8794866.1 Melanopsin-B like protein [Argiope bruennichi]
MNISSGVCSIPYRSQSFNTIAAIFIFLLSSVSMAGNGLVLLSFATCSHLRIQKGSFFVANLAISDFLCSVYVMLPCILCLIHNSYCVTGVACRVHAVVNSTFFTCSNMSIAAINIDRAIAVNRPFEYRNLVTSFRVKIVIAYIWFHCLCLASIAGFADWVSFVDWELMCTPEWSKENSAYAITAATLSFFLPSFLLLVSNISIVYAIRKSRIVVFQNRTIAGGNGHQLGIKSNTKTLRSLYFLVLAHFICVPSYYITKIGSAIIGKNIIIDGFCLAPVGLLFTAAAINPFIYALLRKDHRQAFLNTLQMVFDKFKATYTYLFGNSMKEME